MTFAELIANRIKEKLADKREPLPWEARLTPVGIFRFANKQNTAAMYCGVLPFQDRAWPKTGIQCTI